MFQSPFLQFLMSLSGPALQFESWSVHFFPFMFCFTLKRSYTPHYRIHLALPGWQLQFNPSSYYFKSVLPKAVVEKMWNRRWLPRNDHDDKNWEQQSMWNCVFFTTCFWHQIHLNKPLLKFLPLTHTVIAISLLQPWVTST